MPVQRLMPLAKQASCTLAQLALAWCLREAAVTSTIVGATKVEHLDENLGAADLDVDPKIFEEMNRILAPVLPHEPYLA